MIALKGLIAFAVLALACSDNADEKTLNNVWDCIKPKLPAGVPEIDIPTFNPYLQPFNLTFGAEVIVFKNFFVVDNIRWYGLSEAELTFKQVSKDSDKVASFEWSAHWPKIFIDAFWDKTVDTNGTDVLTNGLMNMTLTDTIYGGTLKIQKPLLGGKITELMITHNTVDGVEVGVSNMGEVEDFIFSKLFKYVWKFIISSEVLAKVLQGSFKTTFQNYLGDPAKMKVLLSGCNI